MAALRNYEMAFNALGDPTRRTIFEKLRAKPLSVTAIAEGLPISRPAVSQHLKVLRQAKLISMHQEGTRNFCQIDPDGVLAMRNYLDNFWDVALAAFKSAAEKENKKEK
jgi:DNA-binding transcriptional ArsR family regulator